MLRTTYAVTAIILAVTACSGDSDTADPAGPGSGEPDLPAVAEVVVESSFTMLWAAGASTLLTARAENSGGAEIPGADFQWTSRNPEVATVADGVVTAVGDGWTVVTATAQGMSADAPIVVVTPEGPTDRMDCIACHIDAYLGRHGASDTPQTCLQCHSGPTWTGATVDHPAVANGFELLGAHATLSCAACHAADGTPLYPGVADDDCIACHQADYDVQHAGSGYPTTCLVCHTRDAWTGATFDHDAQYFPILSGRHQGRWAGCTTCHVNASDYSDFTCFACHPHEQARMDDKHSGVSGYAYESHLCYACHPSGEAD
jgi:hypothetical protein